MTHSELPDAPHDAEPLPPLAGVGGIALTEPELRAWGEQLGRTARAPLLITLAGDLGAGKTTLVQAICRGYGVAGEVTSPTYALVHEYRAPKGTVFHLDLYRLDSPAELTNLGWDDILAEPALVLVEWPERAGDRLPPVHLPIELRHLPDDPTRRVLETGGDVTARSFGGHP